MSTNTGKTYLQMIYTNITKARPEAAKDILKIRRQY